MSSLVTMTMFRSVHSTNLAVRVNKLHTSIPIYINYRWRKAKGLSENPNITGALINLPDYSFKDNRPVAYGTRQLERIKKHQDFVKRIVKLAGEVDYAVERHAKLLKEAEERRKQILDSKLKPKNRQLITSE